VVVAFLLAIGASLAAADDVLRLRKVEVIDAQGWNQPVVAYTLLAPADWRVEGGIRWNAQWRCMYTDMIVNQLRITSADNHHAFEIFPDYVAEWNDDPMMVQMQQQLGASGGQACPVGQPFRAGDFLASIFVPGFRRGAQVVQVEPNPQAAQVLYNEVVSKQGQLLQMMQARLSTDAARVLLRHQGGEEWVVATTSVVSVPGMSASAAMAGQFGHSTSYTTMASKVVGFRAPPGALQKSEALFAAMLSSIRINPAWEQAVQQHLMKMNQIAAKGAADRARIWSNTMNEIGDMHRRSWENQQASQDRVAHSWSQTIRGVDDFRDPATNTVVELPSGYASVWSSGNGEYLLSTSPSFNPNSDLRTNQNWSPLEAVR
jgi:hypothetical protein